MQLITKTIANGIRIMHSRPTSSKFQVLNSTYSTGVFMDGKLNISKSPALGKNGCVSCDQPAASLIGVDVLSKGGNAADAAIAMAVAVSVSVPALCGIGGDCNLMYYDSSKKSVSYINGCGRSAKALTLQNVKDTGINPDSLCDLSHGIFVTVPGAVAGMFSCIKHFGSGKFSMKDLLAPATDLTETGCVITPKTAAVWQKYFSNIKESPNCTDLLVNGRLPVAGDIHSAPKLAECFKSISTGGQKAFYEGAIAERIITAVQKAGGLLTAEDMAYHLESSLSSTPSVPNFVEINGFKLWEMGPSTLGIVALVALNLLKGFNLKAMGHNSAEYIHIVAEAFSIAYTDCWQFLCDPVISGTSYKNLRTESYAESRRKQINPIRHERVKHPGKEIFGGCDTSYLTATDAQGNACSFIFSISSGFGSGIIPDNCGFPLHDRGKCFSFDENSPNCFGPSKVPLHTIIPAMVTDAFTGEVVASLGVVGRWMQPQGHVQVLLNMVVFGMDPQTAVDQPRFGIGNPVEYNLFMDTTEVIYLETGISNEICSVLKEKGHSIVRTADPLGRGQVIAKQKLWSKNPVNDIWWAGCDRRSDALALGI